MVDLPAKLIQPGEWSELIMGNHALARAMIDTGTKVITTFPGSPTPEIAVALMAVPAEKRSYYFEYSANEKVALEVAAGASLNGHLATVFFKSVGLNVAADSLIQLSMMELIGGMVIILGDDPGANSSQNEQDNRVFARMSYIPMLEPANPQEAYNMYREATRLSRAHKAPVFLRLTTHVCHARQVVAVAEIDSAKTAWSPQFDAANGPYIPIAKTVFPLKRKALNKLAAFAEISNISALNTVLAPNGEKPVNGKRLGIISASIPAFALQENLAETGEAIPILKLGFTYPLPRKKIADFMKKHDEVLVVEELDPVMETEIKALAWDTGATCKLFFRTEQDELMGELDPNRTRELLARTWPAVFKAPDVPSATESIVPRLPQMCPGCGHRSAFFAIRQALAKDSITVADIGCHSLGFMPPYNMGEVLFSMGHAVSTGAGMSIGNTERKVVTFIGDATLFHAGLPGIANSVVYDHDTTLIVMDNGTTAMTGHQPRFGSGETGDKIPIGPLLKSLGVQFVKEVDAYQQPELTQAVKAAMAHKGFAIVIARHPCMLKFTREQKRKRPDFKMPQVYVNQDKCSRAMTCVEQFGCPSFVKADDGSIRVHEDLCIGDGSCLQVCAANALERNKKGGK